MIYTVLAKSSVLLIGHIKKKTMMLKWTTRRCHDDRMLSTNDRSISGSRSTLPSHMYSTLKYWNAYFTWCSGTSGRTHSDMFVGGNIAAADSAAWKASALPWLQYWSRLCSNRVEFPSRSSRQPHRGLHVYCQDRLPICWEGRCYVDTNMNLCCEWSPQRRITMPKLSLKRCTSKWNTS